MKPTKADIEHRDRMVAPPLTREQEIEIGRVIEHGTPSEAKQARDRLVKSMVPLAIKISRDFALKHSKIHFDGDDLVGEALLGLAEAADRFDYGRGTRFSTYASHWIHRQHMLALEDVVRSGHQAFDASENFTPETERIEDPRCEKDVLSQLVKRETLEDLADRLSVLTETERTCLAVATGIEGTARSLRDVAVELGLTHAWNARRTVKGALVKLGGEPDFPSNEGCSPPRDQRPKQDRHQFKLLRWIREQAMLGPIKLSDAFHLAAEHGYEIKTVYKYISYLGLHVTVSGGEKVITRKPEGHVSRRRPTPATTRRPLISTSTTGDYASSSWTAVR